MLLGEILAVHVAADSVLRRLHSVLQTEDHLFLWHGGPQLLGSARSGVCERTHTICAVISSIIVIMPNYPFVLR